MQPPNQPAALRDKFDGLWLTTWCIGGAAIGGVLGSLNPSLTGVVGCAIYLVRRSSRSVTLLGLFADVLALLVCAGLVIWGLVDWDRLERWNLLPSLPASSVLIFVILFRSLAGLLGGLIVGAAIGCVGRRPRPS